LERIVTASAPVWAARLAAAAGPAALLRRSGRLLLHHLLPAHCALCGMAADDALCAECTAQFFSSAAHPPRCPRCANPLPMSAAGPVVSPATAAGQPYATPTGAPGLATSGGAARGMAPDPGTNSVLCGACQAALPAFDATVVAADYAAPVDQLVLQLKFAQRLALAPLMATLLRDAVLRRQDFALPALLCPVPLGPQRLAQRGYNQALEIARPLARALGVALHPRLLARTRETAAQSSIAPEQRRQNIAHAFALDDPALVAGRHIGVVDDVMTSGQTLNALAEELKHCGAARVSNLVFARTPPH
jgi:ComF family protein